MCKLSLLRLLPCGRRAVGGRCYITHGVDLARKPAGSMSACWVLRSSGHPGVPQSGQPRRHKRLRLRLIEDFSKREETPKKRQADHDGDSYHLHSCRLEHL